jgi:hypothetical protein
VSDALWSVIAPVLLPAPVKPRIGCPRVLDRAALDHGLGFRY